MSAQGYTGNPSGAGGLTQAEADALYLPLGTDLFTQAEATALFLTEAQADALYLDAGTDLFTQAEAGALFLPLSNPVIEENTLTIRKADLSSGLRFRSTGGAVDIDKMNGDVIISSFAGPQFTNAQTNILRLRSEGATFTGTTYFGDSVYGEQQSIDTAGGVAKLGAKNSLSNLQFAGYKATPGAPSTGAWATGDMVLDSLGAWHRCTAGGTPGTWTSGDTKIYSWDGDSYEVAVTAAVYVGPSDPGSVPDGSVWIDTSA